MSTRQFLFSGFGGQGILFAGKFMAYKGLTEGKNVSWLPSYGPEMRGGTAKLQRYYRRFPGRFSDRFQTRYSYRDESPVSRPL